MSAARVHAGHRKPSSQAETGHFSGITRTKEGGPGLTHSGLRLQAKLRIGAPNDKYEQEADRVAEQVLRMPEPTVQRQCAACASGKGLCPKCAAEEEQLHRKPLAATITPLIQRRSLASTITPLVQRQPVEEGEEEELLQTKSSTGQPPQVTPQLSAQIHSLRGGGQPLPPPARAFFEPRLGADFSAVRVHRDGRAAQLAQAVHARAFTVGRDVVFGSGEYAPDSEAGKRLMAHELAHVVQQREPVPFVQRDATETEASLDPRDDPTRFRSIHERLFVTTPGGGTRLPWKDATADDPGTARVIITQFKRALRELIRRHPESVGGVITTRTTETAAEADAARADERIRARFPHYITTRLSDTQLREAVGILTPTQTSAENFLRQWLANRLPRWTDIENYDIAPDDPRFQRMLTDLLNDSFAGPKIRILASRQSAFIERSDTGRRIFLHRGISAAQRMPTLIHELTHFYVHEGFNQWIEQSTNKDFYEEGFTEYLARLVMTEDERRRHGTYQARWEAIRDQVARYVSDDDIARAYFMGEVWRLEASSEVARRLLGEQIGLREGTPRREEIEQSHSSPGIVQIVIPEQRYRFINLGVARAEPKPEHIAFFQQIYHRYIAGHPEVRIRFVGHASSPGSERFNRELARRRSAAFYEMARTTGVPERQLVEADSPPHEGERRPTAPNETVHGRAFNRRVEMYLIRPAR